MDFSQRIVEGIVVGLIAGSSYFFGYYKGRFEAFKLVAKINMNSMYGKFAFSKYPKEILDKEDRSI